MSKKTLNKTNLEALGASQLAELLMEVSMGSADIKRRLRLELSHNLGAAELAQDVRKRLVTLRRSTGYVGWRKRKALIKDLETQLAMIVEKIAPDAPDTAFDLLWQFIEIAPSVYARVDDSRGEIGEVFRTALGQIAPLTQRARPDPDALAGRVWGAVQDNGYGEWDGIITLTAPALGATGLARLRTHVQAYAALSPEPEDAEHDAIRFLRQLRGDDAGSARRKARFVKACLQEIAAAAGDTQAYIAQYSDADLARKDIAAQVARILLEDGNPEDAQAILLRAQNDDHHGAWDAAYIDTLVALGQTEAAQTHRWSCFLDTLNADHLRDHLKLLPDFEDVEAEDAAKRHAHEFPDFSTALAFFIHWPDLHSAAELIEARTREMNGNDYALMSSAADALRLRHPRAAVLAWRAMIDHALEQAQAFRYALAADYLAECAALDAEIDDYGTIFAHVAYVEQLKTRHGRKSSFWDKVGPHGA